MLNFIVSCRPGEVFVHRNIGNQVPGNDLNALSVLEYAVVHLKITDVIVTGHYDCGAVRAATSRQDLGTLEHWLRLIRDVYRLHKDYLDMIKVSSATFSVIIILLFCYLFTDHYYLISYCRTMNSATTHWWS